ncbi:UDP-glycosyltransferase UGT5 [Pseudolycoriella hygida]|uniref:UDP-glycosyltransferase UGT5 n=1 Tax=Pseudolycoriella hygida TaxID=35572 RepID=A0A9Q0S2N0_9DIPT|nr:UDP-glycosyltransferase UGT5 [Pseudolycoriella hygida]
MFASSQHLFSQKPSTEFTNRSNVSSLRESEDLRLQFGEPSRVDSNISEWEEELFTRSEAINHHLESLHEQSKSQVVFAKPLLAALAEKGHNVTLVSTFSVQKNVPNYREIIIPVDLTAHSQLTSSIANEESSANPLKIVVTIMTKMMDVTNETLHHSQVQSLLRTGQFDGVIHGFSVNPYQVGLGVHFDCPSMFLSSLPLIPPIAHMVGHPMHPEAVPNFLTNYKGGMNFFQRVANFVVTGFTTLMSLYQEYLNEKYYNDFFTNDRYPSYTEAKKNIALLLINEHFTQGNVRPILPNTVEVSGLQMSDKVNPLPDDIRDFVEGATNGLIFVSFGTNIRSADLAVDKRSALLKTFAKLKQRVLWKFEDDNLPGLPSNVVIKKWLPQVDILAHPNTKVFVSHMGIGGYNEAMYHAVPVLAIPFGGDQFTNAERAEKDGWAEIIRFPDLTQELFEKKLLSLLNDNKCRRNVQRVSSLYRDRPMSAIDSAIFWIEYVIRHKGAKHLQYPGVDLNFIQQNSLDVLIFLLAGFYVAYKILVFTLKKLISLCCGFNPTNNE